MSDENALTDHQKNTIRQHLFGTVYWLLDIPYEYGAIWNDLSRLPETLDCSEMVYGTYKMNGIRCPDGSQNQHNDFLPTSNPKIGDLAFFGRGGFPGRIYHVGMVFSATDIIEARGFQANCSFDTGKVILRPRSAWENYKNFVGYRCHPKLL